MNLKLPPNPNRHQHPLILRYVLDYKAPINPSYSGGKRWLKVWICESCTHKQFSDLTYDEPPEELIIKEEHERGTAPTP